ncbi:MAG: hypothetical protein K2M82_00265, partial [Lachnospiraceae bacterium]|nr:hypothetical protein [Lachnospiraceae bacterium]
MKLTVATYNIAAGLSNGYFKKKNYYKSAEVIKSIGADIITLNEVGKPLPSFISEHTKFLADYCGYKYFTFAKATSFRSFPYGNAILSKLPIQDVNVIPVRRFFNILPGIYEPRCVLVALIKGQENLRIISTHLGLLPNEQKYGLKEVLTQIGQSDTPTVFTGDLNINGVKNLTNRIQPIREILNDVCDNKRLVTYPA